MLISGFIKTSFVDYPGKIAAVIFTPYCNMTCPFCHNKHILSGQIPIIEPSEVYSHLEQRRGLLSGVVISGGEPTLQRGLPAAVRKIKALGYPVKLDTNGTNPEVLSSLLKDKMIDYVAMDIKAPLDRYRELTGFSDIEKIEESVKIIKDSGVAYEFRTTFEPRLKKEDILDICGIIAPAERYFLQQYRQEADCGEPHPPSYLKEAAEAAAAVCGVCETRGI